MGYSIGLIIVMMVLFYFMLIRPENKKKKAAEELRNSLKIGDDVTTIGGILGLCREGEQRRHRDRRRPRPHRDDQVGHRHQGLSDQPRACSR